MRIPAPSLLILTLSAGCYSSIPTDFGADPSSSSSGSSQASTEGETGEDANDSDLEGSSSSGGGEDVEDVERTGPEIYASTCAPCHGVNAEGTALAYELRHPDRRLSEWVIRNGREGAEFPESQMPAFTPEVITDTQLDELFDWLDAFEQPTTGEALYLDYCANCHGADPRVGGVVREDILEEDDEDILDTVRDGDGDGIEPRSGYMTSFAPTTLDDAEVQSIIDWMRSSG